VALVPRPLATPSQCLKALKGRRGGGGDRGRGCDAKNKEKKRIKIVVSLGTLFRARK